MAGEGLSGQTRHPPTLKMRASQAHGHGRRPSNQTQMDAWQTSNFNIFTLIAPHAVHKIISTYPFLRPKFDQLMSWYRLQISMYIIDAED